ncbi:D-mannose binding lectin family protein [Mycobacterium ulcerans str. Harvey]|uniref:D-mannose binding lectin family protein n=1 Tax=Mycobacterium ulcerans str. Harvey TaxID=1299332 RepID=A0ABP3ACS9_MYCUL|nr:D-mannose binding lectin family protein [Mycobacterium ulcerans str. Harvey]
MSDTLTEGQQLVPGESLVSKNGAYTLTLQDDGNLVLASRGTPLWARATNGQQVVRAEVQRDGNFVVYTADKPVWHTDTKGKKNVRLVLQDDRNLVLYAADGPAWSTHTETDARRRPSPPPRPKPLPRIRLSASTPPRRPSRQRSPNRRHRSLLPSPRRGPTPWSPVTPCGPSRSASTATAASIR